MLHLVNLGVEPASTVCCPGRQDPCVLPKVEGEGKFSQLRWYFDLETKTCIQFNFRGMKGNAVRHFPELPKIKQNRNFRITLSLKKIVNPNVLCLLILVRLRIPFLAQIMLLIPYTFLVRKKQKCVQIPIGAMLEIMQKQLYAALMVSYIFIFMVP